MRTKFSGILTLLLAFVVQLTFAQEKTISGTISDEDNLPLIGVNVIIKGTTTGTQTDFDGNYSVEPSVGQTIVYSYLGYQTEERAVTASTSNISFSMVPDAEALSEVVITAFGIRKEKKAVGYAVTTLEAEAIEDRPQADVIRTLNGKVAGVQITGTSGSTGAATKFTIRGQSSITGDNTPLFIVDGVPFGGDTNDGRRDGGSSFTNGNSVLSSRFLDLDPNNIESFTVLKGLSAAVLYGQEGRNGVVLITTKNGGAQDLNKKFEVSVTQSVYITEISNLPEYQNDYGQGANNALNPGFVGNWGGRLDAGLMIAHPLSGNFGDVFPEFAGLEIPYVAAEDNVSSFFRTGIGRNTSVNVSGSSDGNVSYNMNFGHTDEQGYIPTNDLRRYNLGFGGRAKLSNNFTFDGSANYSNTHISSPPITANNGGGASIFTRLLFTPRNVDLGNLPFQNPNDGSNVYYRSDQDNPYWLLNNARTTQDISRFFGRMNAVYAFSDSFEWTFRFGLDTYTETQESRINKGGVNTPNGNKRTFTGQNYVFDYNTFFAIKNIELFNEVSLNANVGANFRRNTYEQIGLNANGQIVFDVFLDDNFSTISTGLDFVSEENIYGAYADLSFDYGNFLFLNFAGRNDWASTLPEETRTLFYPSASLSFVPTSVDGIGSSNAVKYLKFRGGYGTSARFPDPYTINDILVTNSTATVDPGGNSIISNVLGQTRGNLSLEPELLTEVEVGVEGSFFNNRVSLDLTVYKRNTEDQIITNRPLPPSSGFQFTTINLGETEQEGIEVGLNFVPIKAGDFTWDVRNNFSAYENEVIDLGEQDEKFPYAGFTNLGNFAVEGQPLGVILGSYAVRQDDANITEDNPFGLGVEGTLLINPDTGKIIDSDDLSREIEIIGDPNPDWNLTTINTFSYRGLSLSTQIEYQHGGDIFSQTASQFYRRGVTTVNVDNREGSWVIPGILANPATGQPLVDGNGNNIQNIIQIGTNDVYFINLVDPSGQGIYDASNLRIREVSLTYALSEKMLEKTPFGSVSFSLAGNNLYVKTFNIPDAFSIDPEQLSTGAGNGQGLEFQTGPTSKRYSFTVKATF